MENIIKMKLFNRLAHVRRKQLDPKSVFVLTSAFTPLLPLLFKDKRGDAGTEMNIKIKNKHLSKHLDKFTRSVTCWQ